MFFFFGQQLKITHSPEDTRKDARISESKYNSFENPIFCNHQKS